VEVPVGKNYLAPVVKPVEVEVEVRYLAVTTEREPVVPGLVVVRRREQPI
jgi:hypothetical protein